MAITKGGWVSPAGASFLSATGSTIADMDTLIDQHVAAIMATDAGWSIASGPTTYATSSGVWVRLSHTSGCSVILAGLINSSTSVTVIDATMMYDGVARVTTATYRGDIYVSWLPSGTPNPGDDPNDATFFSANQFRFTNLHPVGGSYSVAQHRVLWAGQSDGSLWCWHQTTPATDTSIQSWWCGGTDLFVALRQTGDVNGSGHGILTNVTSAASLTTSNANFSGQCFKSDGTTRAGSLTTYGAALAMVGATCQAGTTYAPIEIAVGRVNADVATTGIVANSGFKGAINSYALVIVPSGVGTKAVNGDGNYVWATGGFGMGWSPLNGSPA